VETTELETRVEAIERMLETRVEVMV